MGENGNKWTPEPWCAVRDPSHFHSLSSVIGGGGNGMPYSVAEFTGQTLDEQQANTARAVACVNACAGMADPAAEIERLRAEVAQWKAIVTAIEETGDYRRGIGAIATAIREAVDRAMPIGECPKTADGVRFAMGAFLYANVKGKLIECAPLRIKDPDSMHWEDYPEGERWEIRVRDTDGNEHDFNERELYSTRETAQAALAAEVKT